MSKVYPSTYVLILLGILFHGCTSLNENLKSDLENPNSRTRISFNEGWKFMKYKSALEADKLIYDVRPEVQEVNDSKDADSKPTEAIALETQQPVLKAYILPMANEFLKDSSQHHVRPDGDPGQHVDFVQNDFNDSSWETVDLPHDWAIKGPFQEGPSPEVGGGMGRLPSNGVAWYRKKLQLSDLDPEKSIFLDIDGSMSYTMVWLNGKLVGGWPYGYNSWRLDLTPYLNFNGDNQLAIRVDNPNHSARWYPGGGIYRNVWLVKTNKVHVSHWGTTAATKNVSNAEASLNFSVSLDNDGKQDRMVTVVTDIYQNKESMDDFVISMDKISKMVPAGKTVKFEGLVTIQNPKLWGPPPTQTPNLYKAVTKVLLGEKIVDTYETSFGIRSLEFDPDRGILVNDELIKIQGVNEHHDLGALGAAFNKRAAERKLEILREMGCNAIRMAHNPPAPEFLDLTDQMGFLVIDEVFDSWERKKTPHDFHLIFPDWHEADARAMVRRDKNHPSIIMWSYGNEVGEQYTEEDGANIGKKLIGIIKDEDATRMTTSAMNWAKSDMPFPEAMDVIGFNYQGEGIRQDAIFDTVTDRIKTIPQYEPYHRKFPNKVIFSSETASAASSRGVYLFPVTDLISSPIRDAMGGDSDIHQVSAYELYAVDFGSSADKVFASLDKHPYSAGEFVWTGFDYLGEPTPYYSSRSSYNGIIDLAGFPKDRYYLYQSRWRPELPMVHILPHWNWPDRLGKVVPVHVFTSGDEVELFLNGISLGRKSKSRFEYRLRWDDVIYEPGELKAVAYKNGKKWTEETIKTTGSAKKLVATVDQNQIDADGSDLAYVKVQIMDENGLFVANANTVVTFKLKGPGVLLATDNGDPTDFTPFPSNERAAFNGLALGIIGSLKDKSGKITVTVTASGLESDQIEIYVR